MLNVGAVCALAILSAGGACMADQRQPVAHWDFAEGAGTVLHDRTGGANDGVIHSAVWAPGEPSALRFDGSGDYVECSVELARRLTGDFTLLAWIQLAASPFPDGTTNWVIADCERYNESGFVVRVDGAARKLMYRASQAGTNQVAFSRVVLNNNVPYLVGVTKRGETVTYFVDGVPGLEFGVRDPADPVIPLCISQAGQSFHGFIYDLTLYDRALLPGEIVAEYASAAGVHGKDASWVGSHFQRNFPMMPALHQQPLRLWL